MTDASVSALTGPQLTPAPALVEQLHKQNTDHDRHGYDTWKADCPTCDLLGKLIVGAAIVNHASQDIATRLREAADGGAYELHWLGEAADLIDSLREAFAGAVLRLNKIDIERGNPGGGSI